MSNMASGLDRLEKLFSKRRPSAILVSDSAATELPQQMFPSASFIRPTSTRMIARDEVLLTQSSSRRARSLPEPGLPSRLSSSHSYSSSTASSTNVQTSLKRSESILSRRGQVIVSGLEEFKFPAPPTQSGELSPHSVLSSARSPRDTGKDAEQTPSAQKTEFPPRSDTPPISDHEDGGYDVFRNKKLPELPQEQSPPTPEPTPKLAPVPDSQLGEVKAAERLDSSLYTNVYYELEGSTPRRSMLRKAYSHSSLAPSVYQSSPDSILAEPSFDDFLNLSDDDIAETISDSLSINTSIELPPTPPATVTSLSMPTTPTTPTRARTSLLTLTPPHASRPAKAAAFEAARIAARYNFDLVYVVNLWPDKTGAALSSETSAGSPETSGDTAAPALAGLSLDEPIVHARSGMTGRLLAAYGLSTVKSPFRISAAVHAKILRADGWIEYRNQEARTDEFARGYATAFYTGQFGRRASADSNAPSTMSMGRQYNDRGIVFAAYRKPNEHGSTTSAGCSAVELNNIHRDAEALVEMLLDIHVANRLRQPTLQGALSDETGPMPPQRVAEVFV